MVQLCRGGLSGGDAGRLRHSREKFPEESVRDIRIGTTTKQDVLDTFGQPWRTGLEDGRETWTYGSYRYRAFQESVSSDLVIRFNQEGVVISYSYSTTNPKAGE